MATVFECWDSLQNRYAGFRRLIAKHQLENELASIIRTVGGHKRNKVPKGAPQYQSLWNAADTKVKRFCETHHVNRAEIEAQIPALRELQELAQKPSASNRAAKASVGLVTGTVLIIAVGFITGLIHWLFTAGYQLAEHLTHLLR